MSPRTQEQLTPDTLALLLAAQQQVTRSERAFRRAVKDACDEASVRVVAAALGVSPTTVQKWKTEAT